MQPHVHSIVILLKIQILFHRHHCPHQKIFHQSVVNLELDVSAQPVQRPSVEKTPLSKYIAQAIKIFLDNVAINLYVFRVGETEGNTDNINKNTFLSIQSNPDSQQCHHDKKNYNENETWSIDECTTCTCRSGLVDCTSVQCPIDTHCGYMYKPENECCPRCGGKFIYSFVSFS